MAEVRAAPNVGYLARAHRFLAAFGLFYVTVIGLLAVPWFQRHAIYMHAFNFPFGAKFDQPHLYGLAPNRATNLNLTAADGVRLGAWFVLSQDLANAWPLSDEQVNTAIGTRPTIIFLHGNAGNRASIFRPKVYGAYTTRLRANVLTIDYRGFGDSEGIPTEKGRSYEDARGAWDWLIARGATASDIVLMGQSLGTGVAAGFAAQLAEENISPRGVVLVAGFQSFPLMLEEYRMFGWLPILGPLRIFPFITKLLFRFLNSHFNTQLALPILKAPVILVHANDDTDIPCAQSFALFNTLLDDYLTPIPERLKKVIGAVSLRPIQNTRTAERTKLVLNADLAFGDLQHFAGNHGSISLLRPHTGGHNEVLLSEGVIDYIGSMLNLRHH
ncbi:alpha/beta-hydrolase [Auriculariales sp. MPI-PUGE-AT-0066]|nr:alpha/beta-hydrolase [Auriculariales sp. MPI-PUGE-AT-0066]